MPSRAATLTVVESQETIMKKITVLAALAFALVAGTAVV
jgi:hypothetical protein